MKYALIQNETVQKIVDLPANFDPNAVRQKFDWRPVIYSSIPIAGPYQKVVEQIVLASGNVYDNYILTGVSLLEAKIYKKALFESSYRAALSSGYTIGGSNFILAYDGETRSDLNSTLNYINQYSLPGNVTVTVSSSNGLFRNITVNQFNNQYPLYLSGYLQLKNDYLQQIQSVNQQTTVTGVMAL